jgi:replicative DNA helicase
MKVGKTHLFNSEVLSKEGNEPIFIVEGEIDALSIIEAGGNAVGLGGVSNTGLLELAVNKERPSEPLILCLDSDVAGKDASGKIESFLTREGIAFANKSEDILKGYKDPNKLLVENREKLENAITEIKNNVADMKKNIPIFITRSFKDERDITAAGGRVLTVESEEEADLLKIKKELEACRPSKPVILTFESISESGDKIKEEVIKVLKELDIDYLLSPIDIMYKSGDLKISVEEQIKRAEKKEDIEKKIKSLNAAENVQDCLYQIEKNASETAIKTGFNEFDKALGKGLRRGRLYGIGAISSLGKTTFALNITDNIAVNNQDVLIMSLEMSKFELMIKSISRETFKYCEKHSIDTKENPTTALELMNGISGKEYEKYSKDKKNAIDCAIEEYRTKQAQHIFISEGIDDVGTKQIRRLLDDFTQLGRPAPVIIVDYLQIMSAYNEKLNDKQNIDKNITELKRISRDYNTPVVVISSFNRENYLSEVSFESFKESGAIEYSTDVLIGLQLKIDYEKKSQSTEEKNKKREAINEAKNKYPRHIELVILKNRMYKAWSKVCFNYYPQYDHFEEKKCNECTLESCKDKERNTNDQ